jgi:hypothetical protein
MNASPSRDMFMKAKYIIIFVLCVVILAASEYIFLVELTSEHRLYILSLTTIIAILSIVTIFFCYQRFGRNE